MARRVENPDGMFPVKYHDGMTVKEAAPILQEFFEGDPIKKALARLTNQAETFALFDGMPKQFRSDTKRLASLVSSLTVFLERGDIGNAVLRAIDAGALAEKLFLQATFEGTVTQANRKERGIRRGNKKQSKRAKDKAARAEELWAEWWSDRQLSWSELTPEKRKTRKRPYIFDCIAKQLRQEGLKTSASTVRQTYLKNI
jgi:hypothetical protein